MSQLKHGSYADLTNPALKDAINQNCQSSIQLATLVAEFAEEMARVHEHFAKEVQTVINAFRAKTENMKKERYVSTPSTIYNAWEYSLKETEVDAQAHLDASALLMKNMCCPLQEVARYKDSQASKLQMFRDDFDKILQQSELQLQQREQAYLSSYDAFKSCGNLDNREGKRHEFHNAHNEYILQLRASNRVIEELQVAVPQILEELDEIYIDTSNTVNVAIESHSLLLLTKANEQQRRLETLLKCCRQVNPQLDVSYFTKTLSGGETSMNIQRHKFCPADHTINSTEQEVIVNHLIVDRVTESLLHERRSALQREGMELASYIKQNQDISHSLINICQRNLANHLHSKVYETQEDMCRKRNEIRMATLQLGAVRAQIELLTPKQNGSVDEEEKKNPSTIRGMWKKAFKTLKSSPSVEKLTERFSGRAAKARMSDTPSIVIDHCGSGLDDGGGDVTPCKHRASPKIKWKRVLTVISATVGFRTLSKKSSFSKKKQNSKEADEEVEDLNRHVDPVYSLLKCAADLPRAGGKSPCMVHAHCSGQHQPGQTYARHPSGGDSSGNTSKASSPSSSVSHSPKTRRKKLNARMKSFSLDTPEPPKQLLGIDETTKKKSSSFTNTCFGGRESPDEKTTFSASSLRKKFAFAKASSLEMEEKKPARSYSPSPKQSPKSQRKEKVNLYVALYNFKAKEKDDMDLRSGWRVNVTDSSKKDWWKGKSHGKSGYFPAAYVIPIQAEQKVFQVLQPLNLSDGNYAIKFHKDQVVFQIGEEVEGMITIRAANNRQAMCPLQCLQEL